MFGCCGMQRTSLWRYSSRLVRWRPNQRGMHSESRIDAFLGFAGLFARCCLRSRSKDFGSDVVFCLVQSHHHCHIKYHTGISSEHKLCMCISLLNGLKPRPLSLRSSPHTPMA